MKHLNSFQSSVKRQQGISLVEVLVSMALGIFFLGMAVNYLLIGQQSTQVQDSGSRVQENARFASNLLRESLRLAGYNGDATNPTIPAFVFTNDCGGFNPCSDDELGGNVGDSVAVSLIADNNISQDCLGNAVNQGTEFANVFWVQEVDGVRSLYCRGWQITPVPAAWLSAAQPLVDGIEQMQVQYGLSDVGLQDLNGPVVGFLSATSVSALPNGWEYVRSIRVSIVVDSGLGTDASDRAGAAALQADSRTYALLDGPDWTVNDDRIRRVYTSTIELNNSFE